jgi:hypothetical protein
MTQRTQLATSDNGRYSYWLAEDRYIYQKSEETGAWLGWLCSLDAWERTFSCSADFGVYSEYSPAQERAIRLQAQGWRMHIERDRAGWRMFGYGPDRTTTEMERGAVLRFQRSAA